MGRALEDLPLEAKRLYFVRQTAQKMMRARGYAVGDKEINMTPGDFVEKFSLTPDRIQLGFATCAIDDLADRMMLIFPPSRKLGAGNLKEVLEAMDEAEARRAIVVIGEKPTAFARAAIDQMAPKYRLDLFQEDELLVDVTEHSLVPEHTLLSEAAVASVLERYRATLLQLPRMRHDDPIARYYGARRGQVFKILRANEEGSRYVNYRVVL